MGLQSADGKLDIETVTMVEASGGKTRVCVGKVEGSRTVPGPSFVVSAEELTQVAAGGNDLGYEMNWLQLPLQVESWEYGKTTMTVAGREKVEVPAGKFEAVRVNKDLVLSGTPIRFSYWLASEVGIVKRTTKVGLKGQEHVEALKSFTPGTP